MKHMHAHLEKLRAEIVNCERIAKRATDAANRDLFTRLAQHYGVLASHVECAIKNTIESNEIENNHAGWLRPSAPDN